MAAPHTTPTKRAALHLCLTNPRSSRNRGVIDECRRIRRGVGMPLLENSFVSQMAYSSKDFRSKSAILHLHHRPHSPFTSNSFKSCVPMVFSIRPVMSARITYTLKAAVHGVLRI